MEKTNVLRILDKLKIEYKAMSYISNDDFTNAKDTALKLALNPLQVFKTIVLAYNRSYYVAVIPVDSEIDLKKAAHEFNVKSLELLDLKDLNKVTGYIRGGCSPIGMKKLFPTIIDSSANDLETIIISSGKIAHQVELKVEDLLNITKSKLKSIKRSN